MSSRVLLALFLAAALGACGEASIEDRLSAAQETLQSARDGLRDAREQLGMAEKKVAEAEADREVAKTALERAELALLEVEADVDLELTDDLLFRAVQSRLLEDDALAEAAIRARVNRGNVVLLGRAPDAEAVDAALSLVRLMPGVASVESQIQTGVAAAPVETTEEPH